MRCEQVRQLFDAYLDGDLSPSQATEFGAHRIRCAECRQALALLEVSGHIVSTDREPVRLRRNFTERLLDCMEPGPGLWRRRLRRGLYVGGPLAAAAVIALAFLGVFDRHETKVAGEKEIRIQRTNGEANAFPAYPSAQRPDADSRQDAGLRDQQLLEEWIKRSQDNIAAKRESGESLRQYLDLTIQQWADIVDRSKQESTDEVHSPEAAHTVPSKAPDAEDSNGQGADDQ